jgi:O-antigen/teichoic acid export membrane protein
MAVGKPIDPQLGQAALGGTLWSVLGLFAARGTSALVQIALARLLAPEAFGVVGMAIVFTAIMGTVGDLGMAGALVQMRRDRLRGDHLDSAFWLSAAFNLGMFVLFSVVVALFAAKFYSEPALVSIVPVLALGEWMRSLAVVQRALLTRDLRFKTLTLIETAGAIVGGTVAVALALAGAGVWSVVSQSLVAAATTVPLLWVVVGWHPRFVAPRASVRELGQFGAYDVTQRLANYLTHSIDYLLVGRMLGATDLGIYTMAFVLTDTFRQQLMGIANRVLFPVYGRLQNDLEEVKAIYLTAIRYNGVLVTGPMLALVYFARPLVMVVLGEAWLPAVFPVQIMAAASVVHAFGGTTESVLRGIGRVRENFWLSFGKTLLVTVPAFVLGIALLGINGAALAGLVHKGVSRILYQRLMRKYLNVRESDILRSLRPVLVASASTLPLAWAVWAFLDLNDPVALAACVLVLGAEYVGVLFLVDRDEFSKTVRQLRQVAQGDRTRTPDTAP